MLTEPTIGLIQELQSVCLNCFQNDTYQGDSIGVFRSHFDWHSSVHAHWMLLSSARILKNSELTAKMLGRLSDADLSRERQLLKQNPKFELPYGQAWLLLLIQELKNHDTHSKIMADLKSETLERIITWLEITEFPETHFNAYHSWLITYFLLKQTENSELEGRIQRLDLKFNSINEVNDKNDPNDFFFF